MFGAVLKLLAFSNRPTGRTLRLLSCPPRLPTLRTIPRIFEPAGSCGRARQVAAPIIEIDHRSTAARTDRPHAVPVQANLLMKVALKAALRLWPRQTAHQPTRRWGARRKPTSVAISCAQKGRSRNCQDDLQSAMRALRCKPKSLREAAGLSPDGPHTSEDRHCRRQENPPIRNDRASRGDRPCPPVCCRADQRD